MTSGLLLDFSKLVRKYGLDKNIKGIVHVGANTCEELDDYLNCNVPLDKILWFEANSLNVEQIKQKNPNIRIHQALVTDKDDEIMDFNISSNYGASSSILPLGTHATYYSGIKYVAKQQLKTITLNTFYKKHNIQPDFANFMNIDVQGAELLVLKGFDQYLKNFDYIYLEINFEEVYKGCPLVKDIVKYLRKFDFEIADIGKYPQQWGEAFFVNKRVKLV